MGTVQALIVGSSAAAGLNTSSFWSSAYRKSISPACTFAFNTNGTCTASGTQISLGNETANWYLPTQTGIGPTWWIRVIQDSSFGISFMTGQPLNTWLQLDESRSWTMNSNSVGINFREFSVQFSLNGSTVVGTGFLQLLLQRT